MIELKHIERFYPSAKGQFFYVLRDVNLKIEEGDFVSIRKSEGGQSVILALVFV
jgi:ABC-type lipoprotein export system ATPase subunit